MIDCPNVKYALAIAIALIGSACASAPRSDSSALRLINVPITEEMYRKAARHCHSDKVIRMRPGVQNVFSVGGLVDARTGKPSGDGDAKRIECVRRYLGIPSNDVVVFYS